MRLGSIAHGANHQLITYNSIGSTNAEALELANSRTMHEPLWIIAAQQTAGRGRHGRQWSSPPGNFYGSLLLTNPCDMRHAPQLGFVAGVALITALQHLASSLQCILKWPNDILIGSAKLAGILLETSQNTALNVAIGMGVNLAFHPDNTSYPATNCATQGAPISVPQFLSALSDAFAQKLKVFDRGANFCTIRDEWLLHTHTLGAPLKVQSQTEQIEGQFGGIDENGSLILNQGNNTHLIHAGDVYFGG